MTETHPYGTLQQMGWNHWLKYTFTVKEDAGDVTSIGKCG